MKFFPQGGTGLRQVLAFFTLILSFTFAATAQTTNGLSDAEIKGQQLAQEILQETPAESAKQTGTLRIKDSKGTTNIPVTFNTVLRDGFWVVFYWAVQTNGHIMDNLTVFHQPGEPNQYSFSESPNIPTNRFNEGFILMGKEVSLTNNQIMAPFANSDFWIADLGLEFFHWPEQTILKHETRRTRHCTVLESTNPNPTPGAYSRVVSWIDDESHGIVHAEAYDTNDKLLKVFDPKSFKKVNGQWELQDMEIRNVQTGSRTWIKFDLDSK